MRVLQLISSGGYFGAESVLVSLSRELARSGIEVTVGALATPAGRHREVLEAAQRAGLKTCAFECTGRFDRALVRGLAEAASGVDIIHSHNYKSNFYALLAAASTRAKPVATCHNWIRASRSVACYAWLDKRLLRQFAAVAAVSEPMERELLEAGLARGRVCLVPNGIDILAFETAGAARGPGREPTLIGTVGRLSPEKGYDVLLEAFALTLRRQGGLSLLIVGDGPQRAGLEALSRALGIAEQVTFAGQRSDVAALLASMDIFVASSHIEQLPMAVLEAMAARRPIVATAVGALPHLLRGGEAGLLVAPGDAPALAEALVRLVHEPLLRARLSRRAFEVVRAEHSAERMAEDYLKLYQAALASGRRRYSLSVGLMAAILHGGAMSRPQSPGGPQQALPLSKKN